MREVVPGKNTNEIVLVLQYYDYNVEKVVQAYMEGGSSYSWCVSLFSDEDTKT